MHLLFLTSNNLATNPRLFKEIRLAQELNHQCTLIQFKMGNWSDKKTDELINRLIENNTQDATNQIITSSPSASGHANPQIINLNATQTNKLTWLKWGLMEKVAQKVYALFRHNLYFNALASSRRSMQINQAVKQLAIKPDIICAHNLATLYPAYSIGKKWDIPFVFDVEDYHPGEFIRFDAKNEKSRREFLMKTLLPKSAALTSASPLIGDYTLQLIGGHPNHQVVLNSFPQNDFVFPKPQTPSPNASGALRLVWFSQKISFGRGLEQLFDALLILLSSNAPKPQTPNPITLTLIGDLDPQFNQQIIQPFINTLNPKSYNLHSHLSLLIKPPLSQTSLHAELAHHTIGLALEPGKDLNNELAISNKIMAYAQAGLYILATDTPAQKQFIEQHAGAGIVCQQSTKALADAIEQLSFECNAIHSGQQERFEQGQGLTWEEEANKIKNLWSVINSQLGKVAP
ncbi:hypothetical protein KDU71_09220 [Carboxylicivirga sediminis]|uniref:Glycosyltransferase subfamily 4-like N-terminal domain-containing protein n=1 Tax=Carboxylicivirga sediminis TaxID=2006564 RepID=A0A941F3L8_9BACT|nr:hypothetical protein [Carboxylicivirga sediminis]MBR8535734.1 hypothetical protein [Carboxylicivirga sediminis]